MSIGYASEAHKATQNTHTNIPNSLTSYSQSITTDDTTQPLDAKGRILMCRLYSPSTNANPIYVGASNVSSLLYLTKLSPNQYTDITIDRLEKIYIYGKAADSLMVTYFQGGDA